MLSESMLEASSAKHTSSVFAPLHESRSLNKCLHGVKHANHDETTALGKCGMRAILGAALPPPPSALSKTTINNNN